ncbi:cory-CC-star protein [Oceanobacillus indicireducens]
MKKEGVIMLDRVKRIIEIYEEILRMPHRTEIARELREEDDIFLLLLYSEMIGIPNPVYYYTLELYPYMIEKFHDWHLRMGMEKSPLSGIRCC